MPQESYIHVGVAGGVAFYAGGVAFPTGGIAFPGGGVRGVRYAGVVMKCITDPRQLDAHLEHAQRLESLGQLASGIAHEINTPAQYVGDNIRFLQTEFARLHQFLTACSELRTCPVEALESRRSQLAALAANIDFDFLKAEIPQAISQSLEGIDRITTIVRAMKDFSHPGQSVMEAVDIGSVVLSTLEVCRNRWKYVADLNTDFEPGLPTVMCLASEVKQVMLNLIVNAADAIIEKHGSNGARRGLLTVSIKRDANGIEICIADDGVGIPPHVQERMFEQYYTTKPAGKGTGQGLALSRHVIENKHGGTIRFESTHGVGTRFIVTLPIAQPSAQRTMEVA